MVVRTLVYAAAIVLAVVLYDRLGNIESLVGGVGSMMTSLILPATCYLRLCWHGLSWLQRIAHVGMSCLGVCGLLFVLVSNLTGSS